MSDKLISERQLTWSALSLVLSAASATATGALLAAGRTALAVPLGVLTALIFVFTFYAICYQPRKTLAQREQELGRLLRSDELTGLQTRQHIFERLSAELNRAMRSGEPLSCALVKVDEFRSLNDKFGQAAGDSVLRSLGSLIAESCRQYDAAGRYGGDEFLLILPGAEIDDSGRVADRLRRTIASRQFACHGEGLTVTVSIGVTQADLDAADTSDVLVSRANKALERARAEGGNRVAAYSTLAFVERAASRVPTPAPR